MKATLKEDKSSINKDNYDLSKKSEIMYKARLRCLENKLKNIESNQAIR